MLGFFCALVFSNACFAEAPNTSASKALPAAAAAQSRFEQRREAIAKALYILRFANRDADRESLIKTQRLLREMGVSDIAIKELTSAVGGTDDRPRKDFPMFREPIPFTTSEYDQRLMATAEKHGLGRDFPLYLSKVHPALLEGRLKATDATKPEFLKQNIETVIEMSRNKFWPDEIIGDERIEKYIATISPQVWKNAHWREAVRETLSKGTTEEINRMAVGIDSTGRNTFNHADGRFETLYWGLGDVFQEVKDRANGDTIRLGKLEHIKFAFPKRGPAEFAEKALSGPNAAREVMKKLKDVDSVTLQEFYSEFEKLIRTRGSEPLRHGVARQIIESFEARLLKSRLTLDDTRLLKAILPMALEDAVEDARFNPAQTIRSVQEKMMQLRVHTPEEKRLISEAFQHALSIRNFTDAHTSQVLKLLRSENPEEVTKGLKLITRTGIGAGHTEIQQALAKIMRTDTNLKPIREAMQAVSIPGTEMDGSFVLQRLVNIAYADNDFAVSFEKVSFDPELYEHLATQFTHGDEAIRIRDEQLSALRTKMPVDDPLSAAHSHLRSGDAVAQKYISDLLNSNDRDRITRGLRIVLNTGGKNLSIENQKRIVELYPRLNEFPKIDTFMQGTNQSHIFKRVLTYLPSREGLPIHPSLAKLVLSFPWSHERTRFLDAINSKNITYDEAIAKEIRALSPKDQFAKTISTAMDKKAPWSAGIAPKVSAIANDACAGWFAKFSKITQRLKTDSP